VLVPLPVYLNHHCLAVIIGYIQGLPTEGFGCCCGFSTFFESACCKDSALLQRYGAKALADIKSLVKTWNQEAFYSKKQTYLSENSLVIKDQY